MGHWRAQALLPIWENPLPDHQATWQWAWKLGWAKGMVQVIKEGGTLSGHASGLLVGLGVSGHSHSSHLLSGTFPSLSAGAPSWLQPAPMILWAWLPLQRISESQPCWFLLFATRSSEGAGVSPRLQGHHSHP